MQYSASFLDWSDMKNVRPIISCKNKGDINSGTSGNLLNKIIKSVAQSKLWTNRTSGRKAKLENKWNNHTGHNSIWKGYQNQTFKATMKKEVQRYDFADIFLIS